MKRMMLTLAMVAALALSAMAPAMAAPPDDQGERGRQGNNACLLQADGEVYDNPGALLQAVRAFDGSNPGEWADFVSAEDLGEWLYRRCVVDGPN